MGLFNAEIMITAKFKFTIKNKKTPYLYALKGSFFLESEIERDKIILSIKHSLNLSSREWSNFRKLRKSIVWVYDVNL